jgi:hypothetical protein
MSAHELLAKMAVEHAAMIDLESILGKEAIRFCLDQAGIAAYEIRPRAAE